MDGDLICALVSFGEIFFPILNRDFEIWNLLRNMRYWDLHVTPVKTGSRLINYYHCLIIDYQSVPSVKWITMLKCPDSKSFDFTWFWSYIGLENVPLVPRQKKTFWPLDFLSRKVFIEETSNSGHTFRVLIRTCPDEH